MRILQGIDLLKIKRVQKIHSGLVISFYQGFFQLKKLNKYMKKKKYLSKIASKFSAKEAASKAIGTGFSEGLRFKDIEILNQKNGKPIILLHGWLSKKLTI